MRLDKGPMGKGGESEVLQREGGREAVPVREKETLL